MRYWWLVLLFSFSPWDALQRIALRNQYAQQAKAAYTQKQYLAAATLFEKVIEQDGDSPSINIQVNLAHSYFQLREYSRASPLYRALLKNAKDSKLVSVVATQLSVIESAEGNYKKALALSKQAVIADEKNQAARYNYELIQKFILLHPEKLNTPPPPRQTNQNQSQGKRSSDQGDAGQTQQQANGGYSNSSSANQSGGSKTQEQEQAQGKNPGDKPSPDANGNQEKPNSGNGQGGNQGGSEEDKLLQTRFERLKKLQLSPEKARQLLDDMRQEEAQYLQQIPRRRSKKADDGKPDW